MREVKGKNYSEMKTGDYQIRYMTREGWLGAAVELKMRDRQFPISFEISRDVIGKNKMKDATVNWSCLGSSDIETATDFANGILIAIEVAKTLNEDIYIYEAKARDKIKKTHEFTCMANNPLQVRNYLETGFSLDLTIESITMKEKFC